MKHRNVNVDANVQAHEELTELYIVAESSLINSAQAARNSQIFDARFNWQKYLLNA